MLRLRSLNLYHGPSVELRHERLFWQQMTEAKVETRAHSGVLGFSVPSAWGMTTI